MRKYKNYFFFFILGVLLPLICWETYRSYSQREDTRPEKYSVILYQYSENSWLSLLEGVKQAEHDLGIELNLVTMSMEAGADEQMELVDREIENGSQGILLAAVDSKAMGKKVAEVSKKVPVVTVETGVEAKVPHIGADDYQMGYLLGQKILEDYQPHVQSKIAVIQEFMERESVRRRYEGLMAALKEAETPVDIIPWARGEGDYNLVLSLKTWMLAEHQDVVVALDKFTTESLMESYRGILDARQENRSQEDEQDIPLFYGIGNTEQVVDDLDDGVLKALVYENEFNAGYEGVERLKEIAEGNDQGGETVIEYHMVEKETLYEIPHERLLFPIV